VAASPGGSHHAPTERRIEASTQSFAAELAPRGNRVNGNHLDLIDADGTHCSVDDPAILPSALVSIPLRRAGEPSKVSPAVIFFATKEAGYVTGQILHVDGSMVVVRLDSLLERAATPRLGGCDHENPGDL